MTIVIIAVGLWGTNCGQGITHQSHALLPNANVLLMGLTILANALHHPYGGRPDYIQCGMLHAGPC